MDFWFLSWLLKYFWKKGICSYKASILARIPEGYSVTISDPLFSGLLLWALCYLKHLCTIGLGHFLFFLPQFPDYLPCSVCLQPAPRDVDKVRPVGHLCLQGLRKVRWEKNQGNLFSLRVGEGDTDFTNVRNEGLQVCVTELELKSSE